MLQLRRYTPLLTTLLVIQWLIVAALPLSLYHVLLAKAVTPRPVTQLAQLAAQADLIVRGQVIEVTAGWSPNHRWIESTIKLNVSYSIAGASPATVTFYSEGGYLPADGLGMYSTHAARFAKHEEVLLFLRDTGQRLELVDEEAGKFSVANAVAAHEVEHSQTPLTALYAAINNELYSRGRTRALPADWVGREPLDNGVIAAAPNDFVFEDLRWPGVDPQIHFQTNPFAPEAGGADGSEADFLAALTNPARTWSIVPGAALALFYDGPTPASDVAYNGVNEVIFFPGGQNSVAGRSRIWFDQSRTILEADFWLNSDLDWDTTTSPTNNELDVESAALHEFGHWLGLGHDTEHSAAMYASLQTGTLRRILHVSDIAGITYVYPCPAPPCIPDIYVADTPTPSPTPSSTESPTERPTASPTESQTATATSSNTPTVTATVSTTPTPSATPISTQRDTPTPTATISPTQPVTATPTLAPTIIGVPGGEVRTYLPLVGNE